MLKRHRAQYTLRGVPPSVDRALRERARQLGRSLNQVALQALAEGAGAAALVYDDLDGFLGSWVADPEVEQSLADQRTIDKTAWQ